MSKGMKLFIKLICFAVVLALAGPFILKGPDGQSLISFDRFAPGIMDSFYSLTAWKRDAAKAIGEATGNEHTGETKVYRTVNEDGTVQFSNIEPKKEGYEVIWVDPDTNLIKGDPVDQVEVADANSSGKKSASNAKEDIPSMPPFLTVSPEQAQKLMEDAKNLQKLAEERSRVLDNL